MVKYDGLNAVFDTLREHWPDLQITFEPVAAPKAAAEPVARPEGSAGDREAIRAPKVDYACVNSDELRELVKASGLYSGTALAKQAFGYASPLTLYRKVDAGKLPPKHLKKLVTICAEMRRIVSQKAAD
jgi:hypothetical protein